MNRDSALVAVGVGAAVTVASRSFRSRRCSAVPRRCPSRGGYGWGLAAGTATGVTAAIPLGILFAAAFAIVAYLGFGVPPSRRRTISISPSSLSSSAVHDRPGAPWGVVGVWIRANTTWNLDLRNCSRYPTDSGCLALSVHAVASPSLRSGSSVLTVRFAHRSFFRPPLRARRRPLLVRRPLPSVRLRPGLTARFAHRS